MEFSKKLLIVSVGAALSLTLLAVVLPFFDVPVDGVLGVMPYVWGETATATGFYYWKNKNANRDKYAMRYVSKVAKDYGIDAAIRIAEVVLKD